MDVYFRVFWKHQEVDKFHVATCDGLQIQTTGFTKEEAKNHLKEEILLFLEAAHKMKTLGKVLTESGWKPGPGKPDQAEIRVTDERPDEKQNFRVNPDGSLYVSIPVEYLQSIA